MAQMPQMPQPQMAQITQIRQIRQITLMPRPQMAQSAQPQMSQMPQNLQMAPGSDASGLNAPGAATGSGLCLGVATMYLRQPSLRQPAGHRIAAVRHG